MPPQLPAAYKKFALSIGLIVSSITYALWQDARGTSASLATPGQSYKMATEAIVKTLSLIDAEEESEGPIVANPAPSKPTSSAPATGSATTKPAGQYADGSYDGSAVDAYYGTVQVKAIIQNGKISDVQFLQYPNDRSNSRFINSQAMPLLTQEAIAAQSAQVSGVSGATFTSEAFVKSLAQALVQAKSS